MVDREGSTRRLPQACSATDGWVTGADSPNGASRQPPRPDRLHFRTPRFPEIADNTAKTANKSNLEPHGLCETQQHGAGLQKFQCLVLTPSLGKSSSLLHINIGTRR